MKLPREGVGVKNSTSDLLLENCDEFLFYDDLVQHKKKGAKRKAKGGKRGPPRRVPTAEHRETARFCGKLQGRFA